MKNRGDGQIYVFNRYGKTAFWKLFFFENFKLKLRSKMN